MTLVHSPPLRRPHLAGVGADDRRWGRVVAPSGAVRMMRQLQLQQHLVLR